jgi:hypothetical protein
LKKKKLKLFNYWFQFGKLQGKTVYVAATGRKHAVELLDKVGVYMTESEIKNYWHEGAWGSEMEKLVPLPEEPCIYTREGWLGNGVPVKIYPVEN